MVGQSSGAGTADQHHRRDGSCLLLAGAGALYAFTEQRSWVAESMVVVLPSADLDEATSASYCETLSRGQIVATFAEVGGHP